jgi:AcrR family transcriptional regulator
MAAMEHTADLKTEKLDRRIVRTRQSLRTALMDLVKAKSFDEISVEEITGRADVSRATFYLHYKDKEDLLLDQFYEMAMERVQDFSEFPSSFWLAALGAAGTENPPDLPLLKIFELAEKNAGLYRILLRGGSSRRLVDGIREITTQAFQNFLVNKFSNELQKKQLPLPMDLLVAYFTGALLSTMVWWLEQEPRMSAEQITRLFNQLFFPGVRTALQLDRLPNP